MSIKKPDHHPQSQPQIDLSHCLYTLAQDAQTPIDFQEHVIIDRHDLGTLNPSQWVLPSLTESNKHLCRGIADQWGLSSRFHDPSLHYPHRPQGRAGVFIDQMEKVRILCLGSHWLGIAQNLKSWLHFIYSQHDLTELDGAYLLIAQAVAPALIDTEIDIQLAPFRTPLQPVVNDFVDDFKDHIHHQTTWQQLSIKLALKLGIMADAKAEQDPADPDNSGSESPSEEPQSDGVSQEADSTNDDDHDQLLTPSQVTPEEESEIDCGDEQMSVTDQAQERGQSTGHAMALDEYNIYQRQYDEIIDAYQLCDHKELVRLRRLLDQHLEHTSDTVNQLSQRLKRRLLSKGKRSWLSAEYGLLNHQRLAQVIANPFNPNVYLKEIEHSEQDTALTLLIDNSGSMRGRSIRMAAMCADILGNTLERCQIKLEILGFTTRAWKGGQVRLDWQQAHQPLQPGRMNELRHIIYKPFQLSFRKSKLQLGLMLRESLLKENIDGEALLWACQRLYKQAVKRRILVVISDGAPVDDCTLANNSKDYLERHLRAVIRHIEQQKRIELLAIGIGHDVRDYYQHAVMLNDPAKLGEVLLTELTALFDE